MDKSKQEKVARFLADKAMAEAVREVLTKAFLKSVPYEDVGMLAAARLAINFLADGWKDLERFKTETERENKEVTQIGL